MKADIEDADNAVVGGGCSEKREGAWMLGIAKRIRGVETCEGARSGGGQIQNAVMWAAGGHVAN